jgi:hypothetical protein
MPWSNAWAWRCAGQNPPKIELNRHGLRGHGMSYMSREPARHVETPLPGDARGLGLIFWGVDVGNVTGGAEFHALVGTAMIVHEAFATVLAILPRREGTLGKMRLSPIARAIAAQIRGEESSLQPPSLEAAPKPPAWVGISKTDSSIPWATSASWLLTGTS